MNTKLWIDDIRNPPQHYTDVDIARTYDEAIAFLTANEYSDVYLDHDLADIKNGVERTGYSVVLWLIDRKHIDNLYVPPNYHMLTSNPVGRPRMMGAIERYL